MSCNHKPSRDGLIITAIVSVAVVLLTLAITAPGFVHFKTEQIRADVPPRTVTAFMDGAVRCIQEIKK